MNTTFFTGRRLRAKIAGYEDIVRTLRGHGYRFDPHPDVLIEAL
jgi:DNA-binding response OmpR family regulator